jgi:hypothetical protein
VPLYARVPSEAGHGRPRDILWADDRLAARFLVEDGEGYLRVVNPSPDTLLLAAGTVFARGDVEVAVARDVVVPGDFAALVPAAALGDPVPATDLARAGRVPARALGALLAGLPAFRGAIAEARALRGEELLARALRGGPVQSRRSALSAASAAEMEGLGGTAVGAVFLVRGRPLEAHVFGRHDIFLAALPDLLLGLALSARDEELSNGRPQPGEPAVDARGRAVGWLRAMLRAETPWSESYGAGFEALVLVQSLSAAFHAVVDSQGALVHAGFHAAPPIPAARDPAPRPPSGPPGNPDETPAARGRQARPTVEDERRAGMKPDPGPQPGPGQRGGADPDPRGGPGAAPGGVGGGPR